MCLSYGNQLKYLDLASVCACGRACVRVCVLAVHVGLELGRGMGTYFSNNLKSPVLTPLPTDAGMHTKWAESFSSITCFVSQAR